MRRRFQRFRSLLVALEKQRRSRVAKQHREIHAAVRDVPGSLANAAIVPIDDRHEPAVLPKARFPPSSRRESAPEDFVDVLGSIAGAT